MSRNHLLEGRWRGWCGSVPLGPLVSLSLPLHFPLFPSRPHSALGLERKSGRKQAEDIRIMSQCLLLFNSWKVFWSSSESRSVVSDSSQPQGLGFSRHGILQARILEWVVIPFSRGSSRPKDRTQVSYIAGSFFINWATREAQTTFGAGAGGHFHPSHLLAPLHNDLPGHALRFTHCLCSATAGCFTDLSSLAEYFTPSHLLIPNPFPSAKGTTSASCWGWKCRHQPWFRISYSSACSPSASPANLHSTSLDCPQLSADQ